MSIDQESVVTTATCYSYSQGASPSFSMYIYWMRGRTELFKIQQERQKEVFKIQQERQKELFKIQQERERRSYSKSSKREREGVTQNPAR